MARQYAGTQNHQLGNCKLDATKFSLNIFICFLCFQHPRLWCDQLNRKWLSRNKCGRKICSSKSANKHVGIWRLSKHFTLFDTQGAYSQQANSIVSFACRILREQCINRSKMPQRRQKRPPRAHPLSTPTSNFVPPPDKRRQSACLSSPLPARDGAIEFKLDE